MATTPMTPETKQKLLALIAQRRAKVRLLKDAGVDGLLVACDYADEEGLSPMITSDTDVRYLKYATPEQVAALEDRLPYVLAHLQRPRTMQVDVRSCFHARYLEVVLKFATTAWAKYASDRRYTLPGQSIFLGKSMIGQVGDQVGGEAPEDTDEGE